MACEIESPLLEFYLLVDNEELPHLRQAQVVKASGKGENWVYLIRNQKALASKPHFMYLSFFHWKLWALWITVLYGLRGASHHCHKQQGRSKATILNQQLEREGK